MAGVRLAEERAHLRAVMRVRTSDASPVSSPSATFRQIRCRHRANCRILRSLVYSRMMRRQAPRVTRTGAAVSRAARFLAWTRCVSAMASFSASL